MILSANEIAGLARKAALGGGAPPEQAAWFGRSAAVHIAQGRAAEDLEHALMALPRGEILRLYLGVLSLQTGEEGDGTLAVNAPEGLVRSYLEALPFYVELLSAGPEGWKVRVEAGRQRPQNVARGTLPASLLALMQQLAERTLVPESDASRAGGAGAGLLDND